MTETVSVPATSVVEIIERIREANGLEAFVGQCAVEGYRVEVPKELYDLAKSSADKGTRILKGSGVCDP